MKKILATLILFFAAQNLPAQEYLKNVTLDSRSGLNATFISYGQASSKSDVEINAIKSLFHTLIYDGIIEVNNGTPLKGNNPQNLINSFFNTEGHYRKYLIEVENVEKPKKIGTNYIGAYSIQIRLKQLIKDLEPKVEVPMPRIIVVPYKANDNMSYEQVLRENRNMRAAVNAVIGCFNEKGIETQNVTSLGSTWGGQQGNGIASSNEREALRNANADVYVEVDVQIVDETGGKRASLILAAYETASQKNWANGTFNSRLRNSNDVAAICADAVKRGRDEFLAQIIDKYKEPVGMYIEFAVNEESGITFYDRCSNHKRLMENIETIIGSIAHKGVYNNKGSNGEAMIFDKVLFPRIDKDNTRMSSTKFALQLTDALYEQGIECDFIVDGYKLFITVLSIE